MAFVFKFTFYPQSAAVHLEDGVQQAVFRLQRELARSLRRDMQPIELNGITTGTLLATISTTTCISGDLLDNTAAPILKEATN